MLLANKLENIIISFSSNVDTSTAGLKTVQICAGLNCIATFYIEFESRDFFIPSGEKEIKINNIPCFIKEYGRNWISGIFVSASDFLDVESQNLGYNLSSALMTLGIRSVFNNIPDTIKNENYENPYCRLNETKVDALFRILRGINDTEFCITPTSIDFYSQSAMKRNTNATEIPNLDIMSKYSNLKWRNNSNDYLDEKLGNVSSKQGFNVRFNEHSVPISFLISKYSNSSEILNYYINTYKNKNWNCFEANFEENGERFNVGDPIKHKVVKFPLTISSKVVTYTKALVKTKYFISSPECYDSLTNNIDNTEKSITATSVSDNQNPA